MEAIFSVLVGIFFSVAIYLMLSRHSVRLLLGIAILGNAVNLLLFTAGRLTREVPPIIGAGEDTLASTAANPLPQALILTAIVISFCFFCFLAVLVWRAFQALKTDDTNDMRAAEPRSEPLPPLGY
ncbi:Na+/H+ antiporter subunit C [Agrobacterium rubi]|uniref:Na+/H+ antiporter subunit C n=1 Tax=Agrobacterium rubi TaxID=28099 RepID=A0AAE7UNI6_9HYPH|nr:Na+/H+ antiporter subunit C [Agrobacterium rubi]NTE85737.1 Na+/H+ antiporter subunit C [Agrobacterium rubi]NTF01669.1 Na+/H+ antiporter subunit C [Agrobacterium rubi]NTF35912.1 Na+/H+ antiporter subunit C [Agrobacterium rubi]OCJ48211.1 cation:proton antiporter [Agrobacterium rubi]QTG01013.1 Na+/H+ antiporter subunit C [Agrobacterium rubi]